MFSRRITDAEPGEVEEYELRAPTDEPVYNLAEPREASIVKWRARCFEVAGMDVVTAFDLAMRKDVDRERAERLVAGGATKAQLLAILM